MLASFDEFDCVFIFTKVKGNHEFFRTFCLNSASILLEEYKLEYECIKYLMMYDSIIEARAGALSHFDKLFYLLNDVLMLFLGCDGARSLEEYIHLTDGHAVFNSSFIQRVSTWVKNQKLIEE